MSNTTTTFAPRRKPLSLMVSSPNTLKQIVPPFSVSMTKSCAIQVLLFFEIPVLASSISTILPTTTISIFLFNYIFVILNTSEKSNTFHHIGYLRIRLVVGVYELSHSVNLTYSFLADVNDFLIILLSIFTLLSPQNPLDNVSVP